MKFITTMMLSLMFCFAFQMNAFADGAYNRNIDPNKVYEEGEIDPCAEVQCGPCTCYCPVTRFKAENYCVTRCVEEPYTVEKSCCRWVDEPYCVTKCRYCPEYYNKTCERQCCRMVPQYYQVTCCRMVPEYYKQCYEKKCCRQVPQYYQVQCCRKVPQYYTVCEQKCRQRYVTEQRCRYVPYTCVIEKTLDCAPSSCQRVAEPVKSEARENRRAESAGQAQSNKASLNGNANKAVQSNYNNNPYGN